MAHISYSELKNWDFCPFYHKLVYIDKNVAFRGNEYTAFGTAIHDVCEKKLLQEKVEYTDLFVEKFKDSLKKLEDDEVEFDLKSAMKMVPQGIAILPEIDPALKAYFGDEYEVFSSEEKLYEPIDDHDLKFKGYIDAVIKVGDKYHIMDWKSCSWGWNAQRRADRLVTYQLTLYKYYALLKRTAKKDRVEIFRVTSGPKKTENALKLLFMALYNIINKRYIKKRTSCIGCLFHKTDLCP